MTTYRIIEEKSFNGYISYRIQCKFLWFFWENIYVCEHLTTAKKLIAQWISDDKPSKKRVVVTITSHTEETLFQKL